MNLGDKILDLRKKNGYSQEVLAEKVEVTRQTISNWELGETSPNTEQLIKLADIFKISVDELLGRKSAPINIKNDRNVKDILLYCLVLIFGIVAIVSIILLFMEKDKNTVKLNTTPLITTHQKTSDSKVNDSFIRTYEVLKLDKVDCNNKTGCDDTTYKITLKQCDKDTETIQISNVKEIKNVKVGKTYEFTFEPELGEVYYEDKIINLFAFNKVNSIKETNKKCSKQIQEPIKTRSR